MPEQHNAVSQACIFIGYDSKNDGYLVYNPATKRVYTRDTVKFDEMYVGGVDILTGMYHRANLAAAHELYSAHALIRGDVIY